MRQLYDILGHCNCLVVKGPLLLGDDHIKLYTVALLFPRDSASLTSIQKMSSFSVGWQPANEKSENGWPFQRLSHSWQLTYRVGTANKERRGVPQPKELSLWKVIAAVMKRRRRKPHTDGGRSSHSTSATVTGTGRGPSPFLHPAPFKLREQTMSLLFLQGFAVLRLL